MATIKTGQSFSFEFTERSPERNNMMCFLWQRCAINKLVGFTYCIMALVPARTLHLIFGPRTEIFVRGKFIQIMLWVLSEPIINLNIFRMHQLGINGGSSSIRVESHHKFIICLFHINIRKPVWCTGLYTSVFTCSMRIQTARMRFFHCHWH